MPRRVLFLMSDTGGGHRSAAQAIDEAIHHLYPNQYETYIEDFWKAHTPWPVNKIPNAYPWLTGPGLPIWRFMWSSSTHFQAHKIVMPSISPVLERKAARYLQAIKPDVIVSVHPFMNHLGLRWLRKAGLSVPFVTVVTDMVTIHPLWICPRVTRCLVSTEEARAYALQSGMPAEKLAVCGQPISLKFAQITTDKSMLRRRLGLDLSRRTVMLMSGGEGFGQIFETARELAQNLTDAQLLIVCGRNQILVERLRAVIWEIPNQNLWLCQQYPRNDASRRYSNYQSRSRYIKRGFHCGVATSNF